MQADPFENSPRQNSFNNNYGRQQNINNTEQVPVAGYASEQPNNPLHRTRPHSQAHGHPHNNTQGQQSANMEMANNQHYQGQNQDNDSGNERDYTMFPCLRVL